MKTNLRDLRKWLAVGAGVGIEIEGGDLRVTMARVRPSGAAILGTMAISRFRERAAGEWGAVYQGFLKRLGGGHLSAAVVLPRQELIVRQLTLAGVSKRDLASAIQFQLESLHPYAEEEAACAWARVSASGAVLVAIIRREALERYIALFSEAGVKVASFTFSAAAVYSALRLHAPAPRDGFLAAAQTDAGLEIYGESEAKPVFSAVFDTPREKAVALAAAELRLPEDANAAECSRRCCRVRRHFPPITIFPAAHWHMRRRWPGPAHGWRCR